MGRRDAPARLVFAARPIKVAAAGVLALGRERLDPDSTSESRLSTLHDKLQLRDVCKTYNSLQ